MDSKMKNLVILDYGTGTVVEVAIEGEYESEIKNNGIKNFLKSRESEFGIDADNCTYMLTDKFSKKIMSPQKKKFNICVDYPVNGILTDSLIVEADNEDEAVSIVKEEVLSGRFAGGDYCDSVIDLESNFQYDCYNISEKENNMTIYPRGEYDKRISVTYKPKNNE